jgi:hypothetical protein
MATNLAIDEELLADAKRLGHFGTKKEIAAVAVVQDFALFTDDKDFQQMKRYLPLRLYDAAG